MEIILRSPGLCLLLSQRYISISCVKVWAKEKAKKWKVVKNPRGNNTGQRENWSVLQIVVPASSLPELWTLGCGPRWNGIQDWWAGAPHWWREETVSGGSGPGRGWCVPEVLCALLSMRWETQRGHCGVIIRGGVCAGEGIAVLVCCWHERVGAGRSGQRHHTESSGHAAPGWGVQGLDEEKAQKEMWLYVVLKIKWCTFTFSRVNLSKIGRASCRERV